MHKKCLRILTSLLTLLFLSAGIGYTAAPAVPIIWLSGPEQLMAAADSEELVSEQSPAANAVDGKPDTYWHTAWSQTVAPLPHALLVQLREPGLITGASYLPRQDGRSNGSIKTYRLYVSTDGKAWGSAVKSGTFSADANEKVVTFPAKLGQYVKLLALTEVNDEKFTSVAEVKIQVRGEVVPPATDVPAPRTDVMVDAKGFALQAIISWKNPAADTATSLVVQRWQDHTRAFAPVGDPLPPTATRFTDPSVEADHRYCYRIVPINASGPGPTQIVSGMSGVLTNDPLQGTCLSTMTIMIVVPES